MVKVLIGVISVFCTATANCIPLANPYIGMDAQVRHIKFKHNFGQNILKYRYPQGNFFGGFMLNSHLGIEGGYQFSKKQYTSRIDKPNDIILGFPLTDFAYSPYRTDDNRSNAYSKINGWNLNLIGTLPIPHTESNFQLIGSIGASHLQLKAKNTLTHTRTIVFPMLDAPIVDTYVHPVHFKKRKTVLRLSGGFQYKTTDSIGFRVLLGWENTAKLEAKAQTRSVAKYTVYSARRLRALSRAKPKNSIHYGVGIFFVFP
jgi:hypothetical protein